MALSTVSICLLTLTLYFAGRVGAVPVRNVTVSDDPVAYETLVKTVTTVVCPSESPSISLTTVLTTTVTRESVLFSTLISTPYSKSGTSISSALSRAIGNTVMEDSSSTRNLQATTSTSTFNPQTSTSTPSDSFIPSSSASPILSRNSELSSGLSTPSSYYPTTASSTSFLETTPPPSSMGNTMSSMSSTLSRIKESMTVAKDDIFTAVDFDVAPPQIPHNNKHPVDRTGIKDKEDTPHETNKFYANFFLGSQTNSVWTHPYVLQWAKANSTGSNFGMGISHTDSDKVAYAPGSPPSRFYLNPIGIHSLILSAKELGKDTELTTDSLAAFSANANLAPNKGDKPIITFPVLQGMGWVTGRYTNSTPLIQSVVGVRSFNGPIMVGETAKYQVVTEDSFYWMIYITGSDSNDAAKAFKKVDRDIVGPPAFNGIIQIAKNPIGEQGEALYDKASGSYATGATLTGSVKEDSKNKNGVYGLTWKKEGTNPLLMFALPHHVQSFDSETASKKTNLQLRTTTKGIATAILTDTNKMTLSEPNLPYGIDFAPWTPPTGVKCSLAASAVSAINSAATTELSQNMEDQTNLDSMYYAGKALAKFATILYVVHDIANNPPLAKDGLEKLKVQFDRFIQNKQKHPLVYDDNWHGVISSAGFTDPGADFGNTNYNDHHFHYGYHVYAAAVIAYLDPEWLTQGTNKAWVQMLVKDFANSDQSGGGAYPFSRSFDWYHGHSWAKGLFESGDGKDQESTSEDAFASYGLKMWGKIIGDSNMEARGNLMLAIQARSFNNYFYMQNNNTIQPPQFIGNKVTGILFENKIDHATYFGANPEYISGIHMLPLSPLSPYLRPQQFVREEWDTFFSNGRANVDGGWRGILYANLAIINPKASYQFFEKGIDGKWDWAWIDGGASRTWYLAWTAGLGGADTTEQVRRVRVGEGEPSVGKQVRALCGVRDDDG